MMRGMAMERCIGLMGVATKENGLMVSRME